MLKKHPIIAYYLKKIILYVFTIWGAFTITFVLFRLLPSNPVEAWVKTLERQYSRQSTGAASEADYYKEIFGLNGTIWDQYTHYLNQVFLHGNLGPSFVNYPDPVQTLILKRLPWTIVLLGTSLIISWVLGLFIGTLAGWFRESRASGAITNVSIALSQIPAYLIALLLVLILGYQLALLPTRGAWDAQYAVGFNIPFILSTLQHAILPATAIVLVSVAGWILSTRSLIVSLLGEDYLVYAEAKGLKPWSIMRRYALRNAMLPQATALAITLGLVMNGQLLIEVLFVYPGLGDLLNTAINDYDFNTVMGIILISIVSVMTASLLIDLALPLIDPRIRTQIQAA
jgi:peptide/nickel transport system permease protein